MEVAVIDWKNIDSRFVTDEVYEHINAPQWIDFSVPDDAINDEAWFCRPSCNHPKTVEDFFKERDRTPTSISKLQRSASVSEVLPFGDKNKRDATLKKRGVNQPFISPNTKYNRNFDDSENQDPNFSTPSNRKGHGMKEGIKSSAERKKLTDDIITTKNQAPRLKSTLSARNLFSGGDLLNKVAEFCNELKKLATRGKDGAEDVNGGNAENSPDLDDKEKERKPLLQLNLVKSEATVKSNSKEKQRRKKRNDDAENTPLSVDVKNIKRKEEESLLQIRTSPPTPQCFSASRGPTKATPKSYRSKPQPQERGILQELKPINKEDKSDELRDKNNHGRDVAAAIAEKEARSLDVFWFLKPCTNSS
ncbi:uncharacterized protein LOC111386542 isoform X2 [Olea europaea var. sylvestris]|uniref:uncharacterized protein LOC111386542 isoform X1 n=1 Tax=Olea europaea var. sylvestris TaxID=158386 RepID=UPI000C1CF0BF|nr:uncharacterized protein LOC111386542 isoform X1 [Olea europaea var. sylvestris]XP_022866779.1 uncharacterized protein LOC111386542 isoform X2 [Olea europaea var. sylvestris]